MSEFWSGFTAGAITVVVVLVVVIGWAARRADPELPGGREDWFV